MWVFPFVSIVYRWSQQSCRSLSSFLRWSVASALPAWVVQFSGGKAEDLLLGNTFLVLSPSSFLYGFMWINRLVKYSVVRYFLLCL